MRCSPLGLLLVAIGSSLPACNVDPIQVRPGCPDKPLRGPEQWADAADEAVIDDFEDGDLKLVEAGGRMGSWYSFGVSSSAAVGEASDGCVARGNRSGRFVVTSSPDAASLSTNWNASLIDPFTAVNVYDASAWGGFSFWIAAGDTAGAATEMVIGINTPGVLMNQGFCTTCGDYHRTSIPLTHSWTRWSIKFDDLVQEGWGRPEVPVLPRDKLVNFIFWPRNPFDFWIDDFRFEP